VLLRGEPDIYKREAKPLSKIPYTLTGLLFVLYCGDNNRELIV